MKPSTAKKSWLIRLAPWLVLVIGIALSFSILKASPKPRSHQVKTSTPQVEVQIIKLSNHRPNWIAGGTVRAAEQISLQAEVTGKVTAINDALTPGALLPKDQWLVQIRRNKYQYTLAEKKAIITQAEAKLALELGRKKLAEDEYQLAGESLSNTDLALVLRDPQIAAARAEVDKATAQWQQAQLDLDNTRVRMPFHGQIIDRQIGVGSRINNNDTVVEIINVDRFWLEVKLPRHFIRWLDQHALATLKQPKVWGKQQREARILHIRPDVDSHDRQAKVILEVTDPLSLKNTDQPQLLVNDFVEVILPGKPLANTTAISPRLLLPDNKVWVVNTNKRLEQRSVTIAFQGRQRLYIKQGLSNGDQLVISQIPSAVDGMTVTIAKTHQQSLSLATLDHE